MLDLTKGSPIKQILFFSIPYLIQSIFQQLYNVIDMIIVGRTIDSLAYTAIGATGSISWLITGCINGFALGFSVLISQGVGAKNENLIKKSFAQGLVLTAMIGAVISLIGICFSKNLLLLLNTPSDIIERANNYIFVIFAGIIFTAIQSFLLSSIRAIGDSKTPLFILIASCIINIALDLVFIAVFGMDTEGAGIATVIAQIFSIVMATLYIIRKVNILHFKKEDIELHRATVIPLLKMGAPMALTESIIAIGGIILQFGCNSLGTAFVTAITTANKITDFISMPILAFTTAFAVFVSQNYGARKSSRIVEGIKKSLMFCYGISIFALIIILIIGGLLISLLAGDVAEEVLKYAKQALITKTAFYVLLSTLMVFKMTLQALGKTFWVTLSGFAEVIGRAGISIIMVLLLNADVISVLEGFTIICFAHPLAWSFSIFTLTYDLLKAVKTLKKDNKSLQSDKIIENL